MGRFVKVQTNFAVGEINPELRGRIDLQQYESALERARNVICKPQGSVERRPGLKYIYTIPDAASPSDGVRLAPFTFSTTQTYMLLFSGTRMMVFRNGVQVTDINSFSGRDYLDIDAQETFTISSASGTFTQGETITGGTSSETAEVLADNGSTLLVRSVSGAFTATETVTGGTSTETATFDSTAVTVTDGLTSARLANLWYTQSADTLLLFEETMTPVKIQRGATDATWTVTDIAFDNVPYYAFTLTATTPGVTLTPSAVTGEITLTASAAAFHDGRSNTAQAGGSATITLDSGASSTDDIFNGSIIRTTGGTGSGQTRAISDYVGSSKVATVSVAWTTQPASDTTFTIESLVNQYVESNDNFGRAKITGITSSTVVKATTVVGFFNTDAIASGAWTLEAGYEDAWSSTRGWPRCAVFHEGRLIVGGSQSLPSTVWGSRAGDYFDYDEGRALDDEGMAATIDTNQVNAIVGVFSGRDLQIFTTGTEFICPQNDGSPLTPTSFIFKPMTTRGSKGGTQPVSTEGGTLYLQRGGKAIREFLFSDVEGSYVSNDISLLSSHLLQTPTRMAMRRGTNVDEGDLMFVTNSGDGSIAVFSILRSQNVVAPSLFTTDGLFKDCQVEDADAPVIYSIVNRTLANESTCTIVVSDYANIAVGSTIVLQTPSGTSVTFTSAGSAGTSQWQSTTSNNQTATNLAAAINGHASFSASASTATVTVTRAAIGRENLTVTSSDTTRLTATDFTNTQVYYLESFSADHTTDCSIQYTATAGNLPASTTVGSLNFLEDYTVKVIADDNILSDVTVASNQAVVDRVATTFMEIGLEYPSFTDTLAGDVTKTTPLIRTMPVETRLPSGPITGNKKRIVKANLILDNTQNCTVNGSDIPFRQLGASFLDQGVDKFTGTKSIGPFLGYDLKGQIEVTQSQPMFLTLLNLDYRVSVATD